ncbi:methyltransferase domain-containing protein [Ensifer sp. 1H6]|uniref:class I SAM-dependent methyltransferase n=1 Tax=Ensifer sp. 1H6 TaxID=1911585 RepID=UPI0009CBE3FA|nr:methyltransferase domain-containing protein [Ensifer sp. 1H6]OMQ42858.1 hypothetical protein BKP54_21505 [Ensifer sp. 1H6]
MPDAIATASKLIGAEEYAQKYLIDMAFERHLITARQDNCLEFLGQLAPTSVVEVGCGPDLLINRFDLAGSSIRSWLVIEPSFYADLIEEKRASIDKLELERGYLEERVEAARTRMPEGFDAVLLSGLLHETTNPQTMLSAANALLRRGGSLLVSVPNAMSFHRLLGVEMGLMQSPTQLSERNIELGQPNVFHRETLEKMVIDAGFGELAFSGYMFKPFSNGQMREVLDIVGNNTVEGLIRLGKRFPENAAEIAIFARKL